MKLTHTFLLVPLLALGALAQGRPEDVAKTTATVAGVVTRDPGSEPVKKALIELIAESQNEGGNYTAVTGSDGSFRLENVSPGRYRLFAERTGFYEMDKRHRGTDGRLLTLTAGQGVKDITIRLQASAVVEGRVTDEEGDPVAEAQVSIMHQTFVAGRARWEQVRAERTNDLGEYRIAGLTAGSYFVSVMPPVDSRSVIETSGAAAAASKPGAATDKPATAYQTTYYPGTRDRSQAAPIQLHAGDDFPANFSLTPGPSLIIRGSVVLPPGTTAAVSLHSRDFGLLWNGAEIRKDGSFEIRGVAPGAYTVVASVEGGAAPMTARESVRVASTNVEDLRLVPQAEGSIRGFLHLEPGGSVRTDLRQMAIMLRPIDGDDISSGETEAGDDVSQLAHVNPDGSFEWKNVPPGRYSAQIFGGSGAWFLKSATAGGRDVAESGFRVNSDGLVLNLVASANGASIDGVATDDQKKPVGDAMVVAIPDAHFRRRPERYRQTVTDQSGKFVLRGVPPGDYTIFAWESLEGEPYYNPDFLKNYEGQGKALHVNEGNHARADLRTIPVAEDEQ